MKVLSFCTVYLELSNFDIDVRQLEGRRRYRRMKLVEKGRERKKIGARGHQ